MSNFGRAVKSLANRCGFDVCRVTNKPLLTLCGLRERSVSTVIDIGANSGQFSRYISGFFPEAEIYCFEPLSEPFAKLKSWAECRAGNTHLFNLALGETTGMVEMNCHTEHSPSSSILSTTELTGRHYPQTREQSRIRVDMDTLDNVLGEALAAMESEILIKLDVQGYEDRVLRGAKRVLAKADICIIEVSLDLLYSAQAGFLDIANQLYAAGFQYAGNLDQSYASDGHILFLDAIFKKR